MLGLPKQPGTLGALSVLEAGSLKSRWLPGWLPHHPQNYARGNLFQAPLQLLVLAGHLRSVLARSSIPQISAFRFQWCSPCVCVHARVQISPFHKATGSYRIRGLTLLQFDLTVTRYICNNLISQCHVLKHWRLEVQRMNWDTFH